MDKAPGPESEKVAPLASLSLGTVAVMFKVCPTSRACAEVGAVRVTAIGAGPLLQPVKRARVANKIQRASFLIDILRSSC